VPTGVTFVTQPIQLKSENIPMEVENSTVEIKNKIVSPIKCPGPSTVIASEENSGFEKMEVDELKDSNFSKSIKSKRPLELMVVIF